MDSGRPVPPHAKGSLAGTSTVVAPLVFGLLANPGMSTGFHIRLEIWGRDRDQLPSEHAQTHAKSDWWEHMMVRISDVPGLTQIARGNTPTAVLRISDTPLDDLPELPPEDPGYNRRKEL